MNCRSQPRDENRKANDFTILRCSSFYFQDKSTIKSQGLKNEAISFASRSY